MRNLLFVLLLLALASGLFYFAQGDRSGGGKQAANATAGPSDSAPAAATVELSALSQGPGELGVDSPRESQREALTTAEPTEAQASSGSTFEGLVSGIVVDPLGNPVADAIVLASDQQFMPLDIEEPLEWMEVLETRTDDRGQFAFEGIAPKDLRLAVRAAGFAPLDRDNLELPDENDVELEPLVLEPGAILSGRVVDAQGLGLSGAKLTTSVDNQNVLLFGSAQRKPVAVTDALGNFRIDMLAVGPWKVRVEHGEHPPKFFDGVTVDPGIEVGSLEFQLDAGGRISGRVVGFPTDLDLCVKASPAEDMFAFDSSREAQVQASGDFVISGLDLDKSYSLRLFEGGKGRGFFDTRALSEAVQARTGATGVVVEYQESASLVMQVVDAKTGAPIENLIVAAGVNFPRPVRGEGEQSKQHFADGVVRVDDLHMTSDEDTLVIEIKSPGYEPFSLDNMRLEAGEQRDLGKIALTSVPVYEVTVLDALSRAPIAGATVRAIESEPQPSDSGELSVGRRISFSIGDSEGDDDGAVEDHIFTDQAESIGRSDEDGVAILNSLGVEFVAFSATAKDYAKGKLSPVTESDSGTTKLTLLLSKGGSVLVTVLEGDGSPAAGRSVEHRGPHSEAEQEMVFIGGGGNRGERTDSNGQVLFENLELGSHRFRIAKKAGAMGFMNASMLIMGQEEEDKSTEWSGAEVSEGAVQEVVLVAALTGSLSGIITEAGLALAGASLSMGEGKDDAGPGHLGMMPGMDLGGGDTTRSGARGAYSFEGLEEGTYTLTISHATRRMPATFPVEIRPGQNTLDVDLSVSIIEGRVTDQAGEPVAGSRVTVKRAAGSDATGGGTMVMFMVSNGGSAITIGGGGMGDSIDMTDADGRYSLRGVLSDTQLVVHVDGDSFQPVDSDSIEVAPNETRDHIDLQVAPGGIIAVQTHSASGDPVGSMLVIARQPDDPSVQPVNGMLEAGACELTGLVPGNWTVSLRHMGFGSGKQENPEPQTIEVVAGETAQANFDLP